MQLLKLLYRVFMHSTFMVLVLIFMSQTIYGARLTPSKLPTPAKPEASDDTYSYKVQVTWGKVSGATSYKVFRCSTTSTTKCGSGFASTAYSFDDRGATVGKTYYYRIKACKSGRCSNFSAADTGRIKPQLNPPAIPTKPSSTLNTFTDKIRITWNTTTGVTSYELFRCTSSSTNNCTRISTNATSPHDDSSLIPGYIYHYRLKACSYVGCSRLSQGDEGRSRTLPLDTPAKPVASDSEFTYGVKIYWAADGTNDGNYKVYRCSNTLSGGTCRLIKTVNNRYHATLNAIDKKGRRERVYYYRIRKCFGVNTNGTDHCSSLSPYDAGSKQ